LTVAPNIHELVSRLAKPAPRTSEAARIAAEVGAEAFIVLLHDEAIGALTGIRRGDAAFDFSYYDAALGEIADARKSDFDRSMHDVSVLMRGWAVIPVVVLGLVILLVPVAVRKRFAEYR